MLEPIKFRIKRNNGQTLTGQIELPDQIAIERNFDCSIIHVLQNHASERLTYGAWYHLRRTKKIEDTLEFDPFVATLVEMEESATGVDVFPEEESEDVPKEATDQQPAG